MRNTWFSDYSSYPIKPQLGETFKGDPGPKVDKSPCFRIPFLTFWDSDTTLQLLQSKEIRVSFTRYKMITEPIIQLESKSSFYRSQILQFNPSLGLITARCEGGAAH